MSNIAILWVNLFDSATVTVAGAASDTPASFLQQEDVGRKCRVVGTTMSILASYAAVQSADTFGVFGLGDSVLAAGAFLATGTARLRLSSADATGVAGDVWDTTVQAGLVDPNYQALIHLSTSVKSGWKYALWTLVQSGATYVQAGRGFIGTRTQVDYNSAWRPQRTMSDPSTKKKTDGGQTKIRVRPRFRVQDFDLEWVTDAQRWALVEAMDLANGAHADVLLIFDPASTNLGRDSIFGLVDVVEPVVTLGISDPAGGYIYGRQYRIEERL